MHAPAPSLTDPWTHPLLGALQSRVVMSAMTRSAATPDGVPTEAMAAYYARRATGGVGVVLSESTAIAAIGDGFPNAPRIVTPAQIAGWRTVTQRVRDAGAPMFCQLLHAGRITHPDYTDGQQPVSATDRAATGINRRNGKPYGAPHRLAPGELPAIVTQFRDAAARAVEAGFAGVELHFAHGYLPDQFLDAKVNDRSDAYGGSVVNRCRFPLEIARAVIADLGAARVMVRLSPSRWMDGPYEWPDMPEMLDYLVPALDAAGLRMLDISCARADYHATAAKVVRSARPLWPHLLMGGASLSPSDAQHELDSGLLDMVTYGRHLLANADLVQRVRDGRAMTPWDARMLETLT
jgi:N-ethylmaleimide reductase